MSTQDINDAPDPEQADPSEPSETAVEPLAVVAETAPVRETVGATRTRRAPRFGAFLFVGLFVAALLAGLLSFVRDSTLPPEELAGRALDSWGMFWLLLIGIGAFLSLASFTVAVAVDRRSVRRAYGADALKEAPRRSFRAIRRERKAEGEARERAARERPAAERSDSTP